MPVSRSAAGTNGMLLRCREQDLQPMRWSGAGSRSAAGPVVQSGGQPFGPHVLRAVRDSPEWEVAVGWGGKGVARVPGVSLRHRPLSPRSTYPFQLFTLTGG